MRHLFVIQDNDHIVAETADEALALWTKETGLTLADLDEGMDDVSQIADDLVLQVWVDADGEIDRLSAIRRRSTGYPPVLQRPMPLHCLLPLALLACAATTPAHNEGTLISRTAASWAAGNPKGLLFSTEY